MNRLYNKSELGFAIFWIIIYLLLASVSDGLSTFLGVEKSITAIVLLVMSIVLLSWIIRNRHSKKFGLCLPNHRAKYYLYYIPLIIMVSMNLWLGVRFNYSIVETILYIISMLCVGFLEEIIFRGFLFKSMLKNNLISAIIVSSVTFGVGHILNLFNGSSVNIMSNVCQVAYAIAVGFLFVIIFYRGGSLIPCIITHGLFNALSCFMNYSIVTPIIDVILSVILIILSVSYIAFLLKILPKNINEENREDALNILIK